MGDKPAESKTGEAEEVSRVNALMDQARSPPVGLSTTQHSERLPVTDHGYVVVLPLVFTFRGGRRSLKTPAHFGLKETNESSDE